MFLLIFQKSKSICITNCLLGRQHKQLKLIMSIKTVSRALWQLQWGGRGGRACLSRPGLMWPELSGSMRPEAVRWQRKKVPWLLGLRETITLQEGSLWKLHGLDILCDSKTTKFQLFKNRVEDQYLEWALQNRSETSPHWTSSPSGYGRRGRPH